MIGTNSSALFMTCSHERLECYADYRESVLGISGRHFVPALARLGKVPRHRWPGSTSNAFMVLVDGHSK